MSAELVPAWKRCWWPDCEEETHPLDVLCVEHGGIDIGHGHGAILGVVATVER